MDSAEQLQEQIRPNESTGDSVTNVVISDQKSERMSGPLMQYLFTFEPQLRSLVKRCEMSFNAQQNANYYRNY